MSLESMLERRDEIEGTEVGHFWAHVRAMCTAEPCPEHNELDYEIERMMRA